ncbi:MAG: Zn-dependent protease with chaperone function [Acidobacteria bacterium]|nr:MAG: Zn-dependent protease with chaperone function [Acidobacteriota bacterium]REK08401.1 MAG: Zn-dependent protease with chaperone function [Acidobacteriota bacterium]
MDFFERQDHARRRTRALVFWFVLAVVAIVLAVYAVVTFVLAGFGYVPERLLGTQARPLFWDARIFAVVVGSVVGLVTIGSLYKIAVLREGGEAVARMLGGRPIDANTRDSSERRLLNVVEEMAIASGVPVPPVFVLERETGINAFAAGSTPGDAVVGVTRGCMELLSRDELQGVVAHEFSHILNGDMRLNLRLIGVLHGILVLALTGWWLIRSLRFASGDRRAGGVLAGVAAIGLVLLVVGWIGVFFGRLIKSAVSRQREYLADASAVQFTRNPPGLAGALKKIGGLASGSGRGSRLQSRNAEQASHMFFGNALSRSWLRGLSTHPPLIERIRRLEPRFDGTFPAVEPLPGGPFPELRKRQEAKPIVAAAAASSAAALAPPPVHAGTARESSARVESAAERRAAERAALEERAQRLAERIGTLSQEHVDFATRALAALADELRSSVREPVEAEALIYALLLHPDQPVREMQLQRLEQALGARAPATFRELAAARRRLEHVDASLRLVLVDLSLPALRSMSVEQYRALRSNVETLATGDGQLRLFEYTLQRILARHLAPHFDGPEPSRVAYYSLRGVGDELATLLSALAWEGGREHRNAFLAGCQTLGVQLEMVAEPECSLVDVDRALRRLAQLAPRLKRDLVRAIAVTSAYDRRIDVAEAELLRAVCDALDCPVPPFLPGEEL